MNDFSRAKLSGFSPQVLDSTGDLNETGEIAAHLALKIAATTANFSTQWMVGHLKLPHRLVESILWELKEEKLLEILRQTGPLTYLYRITNQGLELSKRLMDLCGYLGPAPVSLSEYIESVRLQRQKRHETTFEDVREATKELTVDEEILEIATLAYASNRSLFVFGPAGNGKSTLGRLLHETTNHPIWIPYAISVDNQVIRLFDPQYHHLVDDDALPEEYDQRWLKIDEPFVMAGGELTMDELDLVYDPVANFYEAPPHLKANVGTYFIDDLGRQRVPPFDLLNRWIVPLEQGIDFLSFVNGKKIEVPFQMMLIVATNLKTTEVADAAFLRRMGYRIHLDYPTEEAFRAIFERQTEKFKIEVVDGVLDSLIHKYRSEDRRWRASEPRDLLSRCLDFLQMRDSDEKRVDQSVMDVAWRGYFSNSRNIL